MKSDDIKNIAIQWLQAFNEHNVEKILALYHEQAEHYSPKLKAREPGTNGLIRGKDQLRTWWLDSFGRLPSLKYELKKLTADEEQVFIEYTRHVDAEADLAVGEVLGIKEGLIVYSRVYHG